MYRAWNYILQKEFQYIFLSVRLFYKSSCYEILPTKGGAMDIKEIIGTRLKEIRGSKGMTREQLSEMVGINAKYLSSVYLIGVNDYGL